MITNKHKKNLSWYESWHQVYVYYDHYFDEIIISDNNPLHNHEGNSFSYIEKDQLGKTINHFTSYLLTYIGKIR